MSTEAASGRFHTRGLSSRWSSAPNYGLPMLFPFIQKDLDLSLAHVGLISSALGAGGIATAFIGGWLVDTVGVRRVMALCLVLAGGLLALLSIGPVLPALMVLALLVGMAITPEVLAGIRAIMDWVPRRTRAMAVSVRVAGGPLGGAIVAAILPAIGRVGRRRHHPGRSDHTDGHCVHSFLP